MNILALTSAYPQPDDGKESVTPTVQYFCQKWVEAGHNVIVIHSNSSFPQLFYWIPNKVREKLSSILGHTFPVKSSRQVLERDDCGVRVYRFPMTKFIPHSKFSNNVLKKQVKKVENVLNANDFVPDLIISHWVNPQVDLVRILRKKYNVRASLVFHNDCNERTIEQFNLQNITEVFDVIGCRSNEYANYVQKRLNLSKKPFVCYSGIPDEQAQSQEYLLDTDVNIERNKEFIYVGRLVEYKKVDVVLKALGRAYPDKDFHLHIVGMGAEKEKLLNLSHELKIENNVIFYGQISREQVFELMKKCFCFTMVSEHETFGMVYVEAMLAGCVTIASKGGGVDGVIVDGENGFLSGEGNVEELAEVYRKLETMSEDDIEQLRKKAMKTALGFKDSVVAQRYLNDVLE